MSTSAPAPTKISTDDFPGTSGPSRFVQAEGPEEAHRLLDDIESGRMSAAATRYGPCTLYPSTIRERYGNVRIKPHTKCTTNVTSIKHSADLRYKSFIW